MTYSLHNPWENYLGYYNLMRINSFTLEIYNLRHAEKGKYIWKSTKQVVILQR